MIKDTLCRHRCVDHRHHRHHREEQQQCEHHSTFTIHQHEPSNCIQTNAAKIKSHVTYTRKICASIPIFLAIYLSVFSSNLFKIWWLWPLHLAATGERDTALLPRLHIHF